MTDPICPPGTPFAAAVDAVRTGRSTTEEAAAGLLAGLSDQELLGLLDGDQPVLPGLLGIMRRYNATPIEAGRVDRVGIPGIRFTDGPRGVVMGSSTAFPAAIARAATWDPDLERRVGDAIGAEARAQGANLFAGVCVNLAPFPGWGRSQESYGEEPLLIGAMGSALAEGTRPWVLSCVKHFALNSMEEARFSVDVRVPEDVLREAYLPHFHAVVASGVDAVMSSYNSVNGQWAGENPQLLTGVLRDDWGFRGFVMTDFIWGLRHPVESVAAGQDLEMPFRQQRAAALPGALADGRLDRADVERAATRLVAAQIRLALRARATPPAEVVASPAHQALAREAAQRSCVLLRNARVGGRPALPLHADALTRVAVLGRLADQPNLGDVGSSQVHPPSTVSVLAGLRERLGDRVVHVAGTGAPGLREARQEALRADAAVVVVGLSADDEGEALVAVDPDAIAAFGGPTRFRPAASLLSRAVGLATSLGRFGGDRRDLGLRAADVDLIRAVSTANALTVVVVIGGGTVVIDPWDSDVAAVLLAWYPGMAGGQAVAGILLGDAEPTGRLPFAIPRRPEDLPQVDWRARTVDYPRWWGQRALDRAGVAAAYPLGFGLGYSDLRLRDLAVAAVADDRFEARLSARTQGARSGRHVLQAYARMPDEPAVRALVGFASVEPGAREWSEVRIRGTLQPLQRWTDGGFVLPAGPIALEVGRYCGDPDALTATLLG